MDTAICPHCNYHLDLGDAPQVGQRLLCPACIARLEIISVTPPEVDWQFLEPDLIVNSTLHFVMPKQRGYNSSWR